MHGNKFGIFLVMFNMIVSHVCTTFDNRMMEHRVAGRRSGWMVSKIQGLTSICTHICNSSTLIKVRERLWCWPQHSSWGQEKQCKVQNVSTQGRSSIITSKTPSIHSGGDRWWAQKPLHLILGPLTSRLIDWLINDVWTQVSFYEEWLTPASVTDVLVWKGK